MQIFKVLSSCFSWEKLLRFAIFKANKKPIKLFFPQKYFFFARVSKQKQKSLQRWQTLKAKTVDTKICKFKLFNRKSKWLFSHSCTLSQTNLFVCFWLRQVVGDQSVAFLFSRFIIICLGDIFLAPTYHLYEEQTFYDFQRSYTKRNFSFVLLFCSYRIIKLKLQSSHLAKSNPGDMRG